MHTFEINVIIFTGDFWIFLEKKWNIFEKFQQNTIWGVKLKPLRKIDHFCKTTFSFLILK